MNELSLKLKYHNNLIGLFSKIAKNRDYPIFKFRRKGFINLNIWGVRSSNDCTKKYNDSMIVFYEASPNIWSINIYDITTNPGEYYLLQPLNNQGTAIITEGFHKALWKLGKHKGYNALVQANPVKVYRDNNKNDRLDFNKDSIQEGWFGINCHRASKNIISEYIGLYSAGCQVHKDVKRFENEFMPLMQEALKDQIVSYTVLKEEWLGLI